jgi:gamma-glutamyltranspeptidase / glutathione hydrolase
MSGAVASGHPRATRIGEEVLARGGTAVDAALAVSAALTVVQPHMNGLGSDFFAVVHDGRARSINGSGWAAAEATIARYRSAGLTRVPESGPLASCTVPGLVASWSLLAAEASRPLAELLAPAVRLARDGFPVTRAIAASAAETYGRADADWRAIYAGLRPGATLVQPGLARTLAAIGADGGASFYHGELARAIDRDMRAKGGLLRYGDLDGYRAEWTQPLAFRYRGLDVATTPPNSQGATALVWLNLLARERLDERTEAEYVDRLVRTLPIAYAARARFIGDPARVRFPEALLRPDHRFEPAPPERRTPRPGPGDTTAFSVTDGAIGVSAIQSNYHGFGSGQSVGSTGINLNDRGAYFTLDPDHHNALAPGRRPFHTLMAVVATGPGRRVLLGSMGGDVQPQANVQVLTQLLDRGRPIADAVARPRFACPATIYGPAPLYAEPGVPLPAAQPVEDAALVGHAHAIDERDGTARVGIDPRGDGRG